MRTTSYRDGLQKRLSDRAYALGLLQKAFRESCRDGNWEAFGLILEDVIEARGGKKQFAEKVGLSRRHLYRLFGKNANPTIDTLLPVLAALGLELSLSSASGERRRKSA